MDKWHWMEDGDKGSELEMYETWVETIRVCQYVMEEKRKMDLGLSMQLEQESEHGESG
jgi:hypothetical protein